MMAVLDTLLFFTYVLASRFRTDLNGFGWFYYVAASVSQGMLFSAVGWGLFSWLLPAKTRPRALWNALWVVAAALVTVTMLLNLVVYRLYNIQLTPEVILLALNPQGAGGQIFVLDSRLLSRALGIAAGVAVLVWLLWVLCDGVARRQAWSAPTRKTVPLFVLSSVLLVNVLHIGSQAASSDRYARVDRNAQAIWLGRYALPLFYPLRMNSLLRKMGLLSEERTRLTGLFDIGTSRFREGAFELACDTAAPRRNVLYIVLDAFRADCLNDSVTPRLWQFGQEHAMRFTKHRSGASQTTGGIFSLFYGLPQLYGNALLGQRVAPPVVETACRSCMAMHCWGRGWPHPWWSAP